MPNDELCLLDAVELARLIREKRVSSREVIQAHLERIDLVNPALNAVVTLIREDAISAAERADALLAKGHISGPLHGVPVLHKDMHDTKGIRTTYGSTLYAEHIPESDALIVERLKAAGAISLGKTNTPEFGAGSQTYNKLFGVTRNPYDLDKTAGGSSGGSAAALAARLIPLADGTDMGGSLRNPASFCNVVGMRPSAGVVPGGPSSTAWCTLAVSGPMARTVGDVALMLGAIAGYDPRSPLALPISGSMFHRPLQRDVNAVRVAWGCNLGGLPVDARVSETLNKWGRPAFEALGCVVSEDEPNFSGADEAFRTLRAWYYTVWSGNEYREHREELNPDLVWNVECGLRLSGSDLARAEVLRSALYDRMRRFFESYDVLALPVSQVPPFDAEEHWVTEIEGSPQETYLDWMRSAYFVSISGLPSISVPCGFTQEGLPVGIQLVGRPGGDFELLQIAQAFETATEFGKVLPQEIPFD